MTLVHYWAICRSFSDPKLPPTLLCLFSLLSASSRRLWPRLAATLTQMSSWTTESPLSPASPHPSVGEWARHVNIIINMSSSSTCHQVSYPSPSPAAPHCTCPASSDPAQETSSHGVSVHVTQLLSAEPGLRQTQSNAMFWKTQEADILESISTGQTFTSIISGIIDCFFTFNNKLFKSFIKVCRKRSWAVNYIL